MDKKNILPQQGQPVIRITNGTLPSHLAELSEEALGDAGVGASQCIPIICSYDDGVGASQCFPIICSYDDGVGASQCIPCICSYDDGDDA